MIRYLRQRLKAWLNPSRGPRRSPTTWHRPRLEQLEDRLTPAVVWDGGGSTNLWTDRFNWAGDVAPTAGADLEFADGADPTSLTSTNDFGPGASFRSITFTGSGYRLQGNTINLGVGGVTHDAAGQNIIDLDLMMLNTRNFNVVQDGPDDALLLRGLLSGNASINKLGRGSLGIDSGSNSNTYTGVTTISDGELRVHSNGALGSTAGGTTLTAGTRLELAQSGLTIAESLSFNGGTLVGSLNSNLAGSLTLESIATVEGATDFALTGVISGGTFTALVLGGDVLLAGANTYDGSTTVLRGGLVTVANASSLGSTAGSTRVLDGGVLNLAAPTPVSETLFLDGTLTVLAGDQTYLGDINVPFSDVEIAVASGARLTLKGSLSGPGNLTLSKAGGGELVYAFGSGETTTFTGVTEVHDGGTLTLNTPNRNAIVGDLKIDAGTVRLLGTPVLGLILPGSGSNQISDAVTVFVGDAGQLDLNDNSDTIGGLDLTEGYVTTGLGTLRLNGDVVVNALPGSQTTASLIVGYLDLGAATRTFHFTSPDPFAFATLGVYASISSAPDVGLVKEDRGTLFLLGDNSALQGPVMVNGGVLSALRDTALGTTNAPTTVHSGGTLALGSNVLSLTLAEPLRLNGDGFAGRGALESSGPNSLTGAIIVESNARISVAEQLTLSGSIQDTALGNGPTLTKVGSGTVQYTGTLTSTFDGTTRIEQGTLRLAKAGTNRALRGSLFVGEGATVTLAASNQISDSTAVNVEGTLDLNAFSDTIGTLTMTDGVIVTGSGTLTLNGDVITNPSDISSLIFGNLSLGGSGTFTRTFTVADGAAVDDLVILGPVSNPSGTANLVKRGAGQMAFLGSTANTYNGSTTVLDGTLNLDKSNGVNAVGSSVADTLIIGSAAGTGSARVVLGSDEQIASNRNVVVNRNGTFDLAGFDETISTLFLRGGQVDSGTGTLIVTGSVQSLGNAQEAVIRGHLDLPSVSTVVQVIDDPSAVNDLTIDAVISGRSDLLVQGGSGRLVLTAANTLTGDTIIRQGTVDLFGGSLNFSDVRLQSITGSRLDAVLVGRGSIKSLGVSQGTVVLPRSTLTVLETANFFLSGVALRDARLEVEVFSDTDFGQLVANGGVNLGTDLTTGGATELVVRLIKDVTPGVDLPIIVNNSQRLTVGRFRDLANDPTAFAAFGPGAGQTTPFLVDYAEGDGNEIVIRRNTKPTFINRSVTSPIDEGQTATLTGTIVDPDPIDTFFLDVSWGDGTVKTFAFGPGADGTTVNITHTYEDENDEDRYVIRFSWRDDHEFGNSTELAVVVHNVAPTVEAGGDRRLPPGGALVRKGIFTDPGADTWTATVDYGDGGGVQPLRLLPGGRFRLQHHYTAPGTYLVTVTVTDDDGGVGSDTFQVTVPKSHAARDQAARDAVFALLDADHAKKQKGLHD
jgi:autotransporter-associated beta strand protein